MMKKCDECGGLGYIEYPDYDYDEDMLESGIQVGCMECNGEGVVEYKPHIQLVTNDDDSVMELLIDDKTIFIGNNIPTSAWIELLDKLGHSVEKTLSAYVGEEI